MLKYELHGTAGNINLSNSPSNKFVMVLINEQIIFVGEKQTIKMSNKIQNFNINHSYIARFTINSITSYIDNDKIYI